MRISVEVGGCDGDVVTTPSPPTTNKAPTGTVTRRSRDRIHRGLFQKLEKSPSDPTWGFMGSYKWGHK